MDLDTVDDDTLDQLADRLAERLDPGAYGDRVVLSRRQLVGVATGVLGTGTLLSLGVDPAAAQAAGSVGTSSEPVDVFAYDLDVQNGLAMNGTDITGAGSVSTDDININSTIYYASSDSELTNVLSNVSDGDVIYLGTAGYADNRTLPDYITIIGAHPGGGGAGNGGSNISGDWTMGAESRIQNVGNVDGTITLGARNVAKNIYAPSITVASNRCLISHCTDGSVTFDSGTSDGLVDTSTNTAVTDNGTNTVGDVV